VANQNSQGAFSSSGLSQTKYVKRDWTITAANGYTQSAGNVTLNYVAGDIQGGMSTSASVVGKYNGSIWSLPTVASRTSTSVTVSGISSFSDWVIGLATPSFSSLTASPSIPYGTSSIILSGTLSATGPVYPVNGSTVTASINGHAVNGTVTNSTGNFSINYNDASLATNSVGGSPYIITYSFAGDANVAAAANDTSTSLTVNQASPTGTLVSSKNPSGFGDSVTFTNTLNAGATGYVLFSTNTVLWSSNNLSGGVAISLSITNLPRGTNLIAAAYSGDTNYLGITSTLSQMVTNHPPVATVMTVMRTAGLALTIPLSAVATNWTDSDGDPVSLTAVTMQSTNGVNLYAGWGTNLDGSIVTTNSGFIGYTNSPDVNDQISYAISDGFGGTNIGYINIVVSSSVTGTNSITQIVSGNPTTLSAFGIPSFTYIAERSTNLVDWVDISTNVAATNGVINITDSFSDLGSNAPAAAYYRLKWQP
jgi:hypothetical protein